MSIFWFISSITKFFFFSLTDFLKSRHNFCRSSYSLGCCRTSRFRFGGHTDGYWWWPFSVLEAFQHFSSPHFQSVIAWKNHRLPDSVVKLHWTHASRYCSSWIWACSNAYIFSIIKIILKFFTLTFGDRTTPTSVILTGYDWLTLHHIFGVAIKLNNISCFVWWISLCVSIAWLTWMIALNFRAWRNWTSPLAAW